MRAINLSISQRDAEPLDVAQQPQDTSMPLWQLTRLTQKPLKIPWIQARISCMQSDKVLPMGAIHRESHILFPIMETGVHVRWPYPLLFYNFEYVSSHKI